MAGHDLRQRVEVSDDDRTVATAEVTTSEGSGGTAPGAARPGDAVLDLPSRKRTRGGGIPARRCESLHRLQERCEDVSTRPAGWSALVDANLSSRAASPRLSRKEPCRPHNDVRGDHPGRQPRRRPGQHETGQLIEQYRRASCGPAPASSGGC